MTTVPTLQSKLEERAERLSTAQSVVNQLREILDQNLYVKLDDMRGAYLHELSRAIIESYVKQNLSRAVTNEIDNLVARLDQEP